MVEGARLESEYTAKPYRGFESLPLRHLPKETGIETSLEAVKSKNMAYLQGFKPIFDQFQWTALHPDNYSKFREFVRLPKRIWRTEKRAIRTEWRKSGIFEA